MKTQHRYYLSIAIGLLVLLFLIYSIPNISLGVDDWIILIIFIFLIVFTTMFGVPFAGGTVSFLPMSTLAAFLLLGLIPAGWAAFLGAVLHQSLRQLFGDRVGIPKIQSRLGAIAVGFANAGMQGISVLVGGWVYITLSGDLPLADLATPNLIALIALVMSYIATNLLLAAGYMFARGVAVLRMFVQSLPNLILFEIAPLVFFPYCR